MMYTKMPHKNLSEKKILKLRGQREKKKKEEKEDVENPPPILELKNSQKFQDIDGTFLQIEIRGERFRNKIYFRSRDVMKRFDMPNLSKTITYQKGLFQMFQKNQ